MGLFPWQKDLWQKNQGIIPSYFFARHVFAMRLTGVHGHSLKRKSFVQAKLKRVSFCVSRPRETQESIP
jgi:hypothetical protein